MSRARNDNRPSARSPSTTSACAYNTRTSTTFIKKRSAVASRAASAECARYPATTLALLQLDSVVGVKGFFDDQRRLTSVGIQCAICHSTVDDSAAPGPRM